MTLNNVKKEVENINKYLLSTTDQWLHFQVSRLQEGAIELDGSFDLCAYPGTFDIIKIKFENPMFIKTMLSEWKLQKEKPFLELTAEDESLDAIKKIGLKLDGYYAFKINTDRNEPVLIIAKSIKFSITKGD